MASGRRDPTLASPSPVRRPCGQLTAGRDPADERSRTGSGRLAPPCPLIRRCAGATYLLMHVPRSAGGWFAGGDRGKRGELAESGAGVEGVGTAAARDRRGCNTRRDATQPGVWCAISAAFCVFVIPRGYRPIPGRAPLNTPHWPTRRCKPADEAAHLGHGFLQRNDHAFRFVDVGQWLPRVRTGEAAGTRGSHLSSAFRILRGLAANPAGITLASVRCRDIEKSTPTHAQLGRLRKQQRIDRRSRRRLQACGRKPPAEVSLRTAVGPSSLHTPC